MKKKLVIVAGSGATRDFGMPSVWDVHKKFCDPRNNDYLLFSDQSQTLYEFLFNELEEYWKNEKPGEFNKEPNFEDILYIVSLLTSHIPYMNIDHIPSVLHLGKQAKVDRNLLQNFGQFLVDHLLEDMRGRCRSLSAKKIKPLKTLLEYFSEHFEISIVTTNYDSVFYSAASGLETGFEKSGEYNPERLINRQNWPCILHLHGSVHFDMRISDYNLHEIYWQEDLNKPFQQNARGRSLKYTNEGITFPTTSIIAGYGKTAQITTSPFRDYFAEMYRLIHQSDAVMFMGYGFGDNHINEVFSNYRDARNRKVVIIDYADDKVTTAGSCLDTDHPAITRAMNIIKTDANDMAAMGYKCPQKVEELKNNADFEVSTEPSRPLSVWYGGIMGACNHQQKILRQLI